MFSQASDIVGLIASVLQLSQGACTGSAASVADWLKRVKAAFGTTDPHFADWLISFMRIQGMVRAAARQQMDVLGVLVLIAFSGREVVGAPSQHSVVLNVQHSNITYTNYTTTQTDTERTRCQDSRKSYRPHTRLPCSCATVNGKDDKTASICWRS